MGIPFGNHLEPIVLNCHVFTQQIGDLNYKDDLMPDPIFAKSLGISPIFHDDIATSPLFLNISHVPTVCHVPGSIFFE